MLRPSLFRFASVTTKAVGFSLSFGLLSFCRAFAATSVLHHSRMELKGGDGHGDSGLHTDPKDPKTVVIFLHGLGDTANGWSDFVRMLQERRKETFEHTKFILPTAQTRKITMNGGFGMPAWADIMGLSPVDVEDESGYNESTKRIHKIIDGEIENGVASTGIVLGGFSQGGALAYLSALTYPKQLGGVLALSSWLPLMKQNPTKFATIPEQTLKAPVMHCHGTDDPLVPCKWGKATAEELKSMGFKVQIKTYADMGHAVCDEELQDAADFLTNCLKQTVAKVEL